MQWQFITGPFLGAVIGYITNDIAIRMMFRPHTEKRIFGKKIPFTPGLIPKGRPRLARAIRDVLDQELLSREVLESALLSESMLQKIGQAVDTALVSLQAEKRTPRELLGGLFGADPVAAFEKETRRAVGIFLMEKVLESGIEQTAATAVVSEMRKKVAGSAAAVLTVFWDDKRSASMEEKLALTIREMLATHGPGAVDGMIESILTDGLDTPVGALARKYGDKLGDVREFLTAQYVSVIQKGLPGVLTALDLGTIVEDKLNSLDMAELESLIMQVIKKELRAIVWLGALLGGVIGVLNVFLI